MPLLYSCLWLGVYLLGLSHPEGAQPPLPGRCASPSALAPALPAAGHGGRAHSGTAPQAHIGDAAPAWDGFPAQGCSAGAVASAPVAPGTCGRGQAPAPAPARHGAGRSDNEPLAPLGSAAGARSCSNGPEAGTTSGAGCASV